MTIVYLFAIVLSAMIIALLLKKKPQNYKGDYGGDLDGYLSIDIHPSGLISGSGKNPKFQYTFRVAGQKEGADTVSFECVDTEGRLIFNGKMNCSDYIYGQWTNDYNQKGIFSLNKT